MTRVLLITLLFAAGCATPRFTELPGISDSGTNQPPQWGIAPGDTLPAMALVFDVPTNHSIRVTATVDDRGFIDLPKIGKFHVAGMTQQQMLEEIGSAYVGRRLVFQPYHQGSVFYYTKGEVKQPGRQLYLGGMTLIRAVESGGGFTPAAKISNVTIRRNTGLVEHYDCRLIRKGLQRDPEVRPNDIIEVKRKFL